MSSPLPAPPTAMQRVLVIGPCGAGKSTLARTLAERLDLPLFHLDQIHWKPGWVEGSSDELRARVRSIVATDRWLIDGNYGGTMDERLPRADTIIYLDFAIPLCLWRITRRIHAYHGRSRPDMTENCPERFDPSFFLYLATWNFGPRRHTEAHLNGHQHKVIRLRTPKALAQWLASVEA